MIKEPVSLQGSIKAHFQLTDTYNLGCDCSIHAVSTWLLELHSFQKHINHPRRDKAQTL